MQKLTNSFLSYVTSLNLDFNHAPEEFSYDNPILILVDATLSMNRKYDSFVVPRINIIRKSGIRTLGETLQFINNKGTKGFCKFWNYNHPERVKILIRLIEKFIQVKKDLMINDDLAVLKKWGVSSTVDDYKQFNVKGIGFTTYQYLRLMCGADTIKPDIYLKRAVKYGTGKNLAEEKVVEIVEKAAKKLEINPRQLDYALWNYYSKQ